MQSFNRRAYPIISKTGSFSQVMALGVALGTSLFLQASPAGAQQAGAPEYPKKAFEASYDVSSPSGNQKMKMSSDGKGRMRTETTTGPTKMVSILDYPNKTSVTLIEAQKMAIKTKLTDNQTKSNVTDEASAKKNNAQALGKKVINGHPSKGWRYKVDGGESEVWIGDDIGYIVLSSTTTKQGITKMELKQYSAKAPEKSSFEIPSGYRIMGM